MQNIALQIGKLPHNNTVFQPWGGGGVTPSRAPPTVTPLARKHHGEVKSTICMVKLKALTEELTVIDEAGIEMFNATRLVISRNNYIKL